MNQIRNIFYKINTFMKKIDKVYNWIIFILLCLVVGFIAIHHEPFRDEVQAWNIARDLSVSDIFKQMFSEGHPCFWHLILKPFTMFESSIYIMTWISYTIMMVTAWLILFKSPFSKIVRTILVFSSPFLYFYSVISRNYCLIALIITLLCLVYNKRKEHPILYGILLLFLFNTHVIMAGMASILLFLFMLETLLNSVRNKKIDSMNVLGCLIGFLGGILLCAQILGSYKVNSLVNIVGVDQYNYTHISEYVDYFISQYKLEYYYFTNIDLLDYQILPIVAALLLAIVMGLIFKLKNTIIFIVSYLFSLSICIFLFYSITLRSIVLIFMLMFLCWTSKEKNNYIFKNKIMLFLQSYNFSQYLMQLVLIIYCLLSIPYANKCALNDIGRLMTDAPNVANYIKNNINEDDIILSTSENLTTVILGYIPGYSFYSVANERFYTFINWDRELSEDFTIEELNMVLQKFDNLDSDIYLLSPSIYSNEVIKELQTQNRIETVYESEYSYQYLNSMQEYVKFDIYRIVG